MVSWVSARGERRREARSGSGERLPSSRNGQGQGGGATAGGEGGREAQQAKGRRPRGEESSSSSVKSHGHELLDRGVRCYNHATTTVRDCTTVINLLQGRTPRGCTCTGNDRCSEEFKPTILLATGLLVYRTPSLILHNSMIAI